MIPYPLNSKHICSFIDAALTITEAPTSYMIIDLDLSLYFTNFMMLSHLSL